MEAISDGRRNGARTNHRGVPAVGSDLRHSVCCARSAANGSGRERVWLVLSCSVDPGRRGIVAGAFETVGSTSMIQPLRRTHRWIWLILAVAMPILLLSAIAVRRP